MWLYLKNDHEWLNLSTCEKIVIGTGEGLRGLYWGVWAITEDRYICLYFAKDDESREEMLEGYYAYIQENINLLPMPKTPTKRSVKEEDVS